MALECGIVGLPNVGKSTLFNALTKAAIPAANYPFCTIEPNVGIVPVPDSRLDAIAAVTKPQKTIATTIKFVDIAGLVAGASKGEGLGNKFLANIREMQVIAHVVRCFENNDIVHVNGAINPLNDIETINTELALTDLETIDKALIKVSKIAKNTDKEAISAKKLLEQIKEELNQGKPVRSLVLSDTAWETLAPLQLLTAKPTLYIANVDEQGFSDNSYLEQVSAFATKEGAGVVAICADLEAQIVELNDAEKTEFLAEVGLAEPGLNRVIRAAYQLLELQTYFTAGPKEVRAWTVPKGATAPQAAGVIHTDFEKGFICAEVVAYADFIQYSGEQGAKEAGKLRLEGKGYTMQDGDLVHFRFNV